MLLFLPVLPTGLWLVGRRAESKDAAAGVMHLCLGYAKWVLLCLALFDLSQMIWRSEPECWSAAVAWSGLIAGVMAFRFFMTGLADVISGSLLLSGAPTDEGGSVAGRIMGFADELRNISLLRFLMVTLMVFVLAAGLDGSLQYGRCLVSSEGRGTAAGVFQNARVFSNFHVIILIAALFCALRLPRTDDFLRQPVRWKSYMCLSLFALSVVMLWTRGIPPL